MRIIKFSSTIAALTVVFLIGSSSYIAAADMGSMKFISHSGILTEVQEDYLIVSGWKVELLNEVENGKKYMTEVRDSSGKPIDCKDLKVGTALMVMGQELPNKSIFATAIEVRGDK